MDEHIKRLQVNNFKKFDKLEVENIGQVNLITGDNNVGKTSLLEAFLVLSTNTDNNIKNLHRILCSKNVHIHPENIRKNNPKFPDKNYFHLIKNEIDKPIRFEWENNQKEKFNFSYNDCTIDDLTEQDFSKRKTDNYGIGNPNLWIKVFKNDIISELQWMYLDDFKREMKYGYEPIIKMHTTWNKDINDYYYENIGIDNVENSKAIQSSLFKELNYEEKQRFIDSLSVFVKGIQDTAIKNYYGRDILSIKTKYFEDYQPITFWGEGFNLFVRYLLEIVKNKDKYLLIDEFGSGIHWTRMKGFWIQILKSSQINNVQLFCTTHNQECINAFIEAGEELEDMQQEMRLIELEEAKSPKSNRNVFATTYNFEQIKSGLYSGVNLRGGTL